MSLKWLVNLQAHLYAQTFGWARDVGPCLRLPASLVPYNACASSGSWWDCGDYRLAGAYVITFCTYLVYRSITAFGSINTVWNGCLPWTTFRGWSLSQIFHFSLYHFLSCYAVALFHSIIAHVLRSIFDGGVGWVSWDLNLKYTLMFVTFE